MGNYGTKGTYVKEKEQRWRLRYPAHLKHKPTVENRTFFKKPTRKGTKKRDAEKHKFLLDLNKILFLFYYLQEGLHLLKKEQEGRGATRWQQQWCSRKRTTISIFGVQKKNLSWFFIYIYINSC